MCFHFTLYYFLNEQTKVEFISSHLLKARTISFDVSFLNVNLTYDLINSGEYEIIHGNYGFIPLNVFYQKSDNFFSNLPLSKDTFDQIYSLFTKFQSAIILQTDERWSCRARLHLNFILELVHQIYNDYLNENTMIYDVKNPNVWVSLILEQIHKDYSKNISLITLSKDMHINKTTVGKNIKRITGYSVTDYIINYRIKCACYALVTTEISVKEISNECGFSNEAYFTRQFKMRIGETPTEHRQKEVSRKKLDFANKLKN